MNPARKLILISAAFVCTLPAGPISQGERDFLLSSLHSSRKMFLDAIEGLTPAQWNFKAAPDRWSIAEIAEHVVLTEDGMRKWEREIMAKPATTADPDARKRDQEVYRRSMDRGEGNRGKAPQSLVPGGRFKSAQEAAEAFRADREQTLDYARTTGDDLRAHTSLQSGMDVYQLLLTTAGHTERHVEQIKEVKGDPKYPK